MTSILLDQNEAQKTKVPKTTVFNRYSGPLNGARREVRSEATVYTTRRLGLGVIELNSPRATPELHSSKDNSSQGIIPTSISALSTFPRSGCRGRSTCLIRSSESGFFREAALMMELLKRHCSSGFSLGPSLGGPGPTRSGRRTRRIAPSRGRAHAIEARAAAARCMSGTASLSALGRSCIRV
jgi:hypothetical protein